MLGRWQERDETQQVNRNRVTPRDAVRMPLTVTNLRDEIVAPVRVYFMRPETKEMSAADKFDEIADSVLVGELGARLEPGEGVRGSAADGA